MTAVQPDGVMSAMPDLNDVPFGEEISIDDAEYARIMRRIAIGDSDAAGGVSAFNSSI